MNLDQSLLIYKDMAPADTLNYRGFEIKFYEDPLGKQIFCIWKGGRLDFGTDNFNYKEEMQRVIDDELDVITRFEKFPFYRLAKLEKFQNGGHTDVRLIYRDRVLQIWLDPEEQLRDLENFILSASAIIRDHLTFEDIIELGHKAIYNRSNNETYLSKSQ